MIALAQDMLTLATTCTRNAQLATDTAPATDAAAALAAKNWSAAALSATQAWATMSRPDTGRK